MALIKANQQAQTNSAVAPAEAYFGATRAVYTGRKADAPMTKDDYWRNREERDIENSKRIGYRGILQACITSPMAGQYCTGNTPEAFAEHMLKLADLVNKGCTDRGF